MRGKLSASVVCWLFLPVLLASAGDNYGRDATAADGGVQFRVFRYQSSSIDGSAPYRSSRCVATMLAPGVAITASHCLGEKALTLSCNWAAAPASATGARLLRVRRHPTHDVAVFHFQPHDDCSSAAAVLAPRIDEPNLYFVALPPAAPGEVARIKPVQPAATSNEQDDRHTFAVRGDLCLQSGDSGTPLLKAGEREHRALTGLLIGGDPDCTGVQTFVRLDGLREWLAASVRL